MLRYCYVIAWVLGGVGWGKNVHVTCIHTSCYATATSWPGSWARCYEIRTFMSLAYIRGATMRAYVLAWVLDEAG